jgi:hypothetical protein
MEEIEGIVGRSVAEDGGEYRIARGVAERNEVCAPKSEWDRGCYYRCSCLRLLPYGRYSVAGTSKEDVFVLMA